MSKQKTIAFSIKSKYSDLRPSEQKAADCILKHMDEIPGLSLDMIAEKAKVSQPTVLRMLKAVGYDGFKQFKYATIQEAAQIKPTVSIEDGSYGYPISPKDKVSDMPAKIVASAVCSIQESLKSISTKTYQQVIDILSGARLVDIYSAENSNSVAYDLSTKLLYLGLNCRCFADPYLQKISAGNLTAQDVAIDISYSGTSKDTVDAIKAAKKQGAATVVITNFKDSPISQYADYLIGITQDQLLYGNTIFSRISQVLIVDMIYAGLFASDYETYAAHLDKNGKSIRNKAYDK